MNACWVSQSVLSSFKCIRPHCHWWWWCLKERWGNNFHLKRKLKRLCYCKWNWKAWYKLLSSSGLKKIFEHVSIIHQTQTAFWMWWARTEHCAPIIGIFQKKTNSRVEDMKCRGVSKKYHVKFPGIN